MCNGHPIAMCISANKIISHAQTVEAQATFLHVASVQVHTYM